MRPWVVCAVLAWALVALAGAGPATAQSPTASPRAPAQSDTVVPNAPGTSSTPTGLDWHAVGPEPRRRSWLHRLATWDRGFAVLDGGMSGMLIRTSADGLSWTTARLPGFWGWDRELVPFEGGLALLTSTYSNGLGASMRFDLWRSPDGADWARAGGLVVTPPPGCLAGVGDMAVVEGRLLVLGTLCTPPCCGLGPGTLLAAVGGLVARGHAQPPRVVAWSSGDGRRWQRHPVRVIDADGRPARVRSFIGLDLGPGRLLAVPEYDPMAVVESVDGLTWTEVAPFPEGFSPWGDVEPRTAVAPAVLLTGQDDAGAGLWRLEPDGSTWTRAVSSVEETTTYGLASDGRVVIVSGVVRESYGASDAFAWTLVSTDGGITFDPALAWTGPPGSCVQDVAIHRGVAVMIGCTDGAETLWRAELPSP